MRAAPKQRWRAGRRAAPPRAGNLGKTLLVYLYTTPAAEAEATTLAGDFAAGLKRASGAETSKVTGAVPAAAAESEIVEEHLLWVEIATVVIVVGLLMFYFRSLGIPLLCLAGVALSYFLADRLLGRTAQHFELAIPEEVEPVIIALLFGVVTDYLIFFVSGFRRRLAAGASSVEAASAVTAELLPVVSTAALMIAGSTMALSLSGVDFLSAFGPAMAITVLVAAAVSLTFLPACLAIFGRALFWPHRPGPSDAGDGDGEASGARGRGRVVGLAARHPIAIGGLCVIALLAGASGLRKLELGNPVIRGLPDTSTVKHGYNEAAAAFGPGVTGPTMLVVEKAGVDEDLSQLSGLEAKLEAQAGVVGVLGPAQQPIAEPKGPFLAPNGSAARYVLVLDADPDGPVAAEILEGIEARLPTSFPKAASAGRAPASPAKPRSAANSPKTPGTPASRWRRSRSPSCSCCSSSCCAAAQRRSTWSAPASSSSPPRSGSPSTSSRTCSATTRSPSSSRWRRRSYCWRSAPTTTSSWSAGSGTSRGARISTPRSAPPGRGPRARSPSPA